MSVNILTPSTPSISGGGLKPYVGNISIRYGAQTRVSNNSDPMNVELFKQYTTDKYGFLKSKETINASPTYYKTRYNYLIVPQNVVFIGYVFNSEPSSNIKIDYMIENYGIKTAGEYTLYYDYYNSGLQFTVRSYFMGYFYEA